MKKYHISRIFLISLGCILGSGVIYATINYSELFPNGSTVAQSQTNGWTSPLSGASKEVMTPEGCRRLNSTIGYSYHVPTGSMTEWVSFRDNLPSGLAVGLCGSIVGEVSDPPIFVSHEPFSATPTCIPNPNPRPQFCGTKTWIVPVGVTSISAVAIGAGGAGALHDGYDPGGSIKPGTGGGGALSYSNNIPVTAGQVVTINVGCGGDAYPAVWRGGTMGRDYWGGWGNNGGDSSISINGVTILLAKGGNGGNCSSSCNGGTVGANTLGGQASSGIGQVRNSGGDGRIRKFSSSISTHQGGGGAAGYSGNGGKGSGNDFDMYTPTSHWPTAGNGGGGAGGGNKGGGGGTGIYGEGVSGLPYWQYSGFIIGLNTPANKPLRFGPSLGGSGGGTGGVRNAPMCRSGNGGYPGGGGAGDTAGSIGGHAGHGAHGAVRIVYPGTTRQFPSTNVGP